VTWPTRQETLRLSGIVIAVTIAFSIALGVLDYLYGELFRLGFASPVIFLIVGVILVVGVGGFTLVTRQRGGL
jgi:preprotein translocase SecE subunit